MPHYNPAEVSDTLQVIDRLRDLLEASDHLAGPYTGRAYIGEVGSYHDLMGIAEDASPCLVVMHAEKDRFAATAGGEGVGEDGAFKRLGIYGLVHIPQNQVLGTLETAYRECVRLSDKAETALRSVEKDPTGGGGCLWYQMRLGGTRIVKARDGSGFISETIATLYKQYRRS